MDPVPSYPNSHLKDNLPPTPNSIGQTPPEPIPTPIPTPPTPIPPPPSTSDIPPQPPPPPATPKNRLKKPLIIASSLTILLLIITAITAIRLKTPTTKLPEISQQAPVPTTITKEEHRDDDGSIGAGNCGGAPCQKFIELYPGTGPGDFKNICGPVTVYMHDHDERLHYTAEIRTQDNQWSVIDDYKGGEDSNNITTGDDYGNDARLHPPGTQGSDSAFKHHAFDINKTIDTLKLDIFCRDRDNNNCGDNHDWSAKGTHLHISKVVWTICKTAPTPTITPTATPSATLTPTVTPPPTATLQCDSLTNSSASPKKGDTVTLTCQGQAAHQTIDTIKFRITTDDGTTWTDIGQTQDITATATDDPNAKTYSGKKDYKIPDYGNYQAQCQVCSGQICNDWGQAIATLPTPTGPSSTPTPTPTGPTSTPTLTPTPAPTLQITNLSPATYLVGPNLYFGSKYYIDRDYTISSLANAALTNGASLKGKTFIKTANDDKDRTSPTFFKFTVDRPVTVYVAYDKRADSLPAWLSTFTKTTMTIATTDTDASPLKVYRKDYPTGPITLGGNLATPASGANTNYFVIITARFPTL